MSNTDKNELTFTVECKRKIQEVAYDGDRTAILLSVKCNEAGWPLRVFLNGVSAALHIDVTKSGLRISSVSRDHISALNMFEPGKMYDVQINPVDVE